MAGFVAESEDGLVGERLHKLGQETQFQKGNSGGPGRGNKSVPENLTSWVPKKGRSAQETLDENKNEFIYEMFMRAKKGNNFISATLINKLVPNGTGLGKSRGMPEFERLSIQELESLAENPDKYLESDDD